VIKACFDASNIESAQIVYDFVLLLSITFASVFLFAVSLLLVTQSKNFMAGKTTYARMKSQKIDIITGTRAEEVKGKAYA